MSFDPYTAGGGRTLEKYPCDLKAGDRLRLRQELPVLDDQGTEIRAPWPPGSIWTVIFGVPHQPEVVWLQKPDGDLHTWDETVVEAFDLLARAPEVGSRVELIGLPDDVPTMPEESRVVFEYCLGRSYLVAEVDPHGLVVLDVSSDVDEKFGTIGNEIHVEAELLANAQRDSPRG